MMLFDLEWRDEYLIFPAVKRAVSLLARVTLWGYLIVFVLLPPLSVLVYQWADLHAIVELSGRFFDALLLSLLYLTALWCHQVLLACRGIAATRWLLLLMCFFAFLHAVCAGYTALTNKCLLVNQFFLPAALNTVLAICVALNWFRMAAAPLGLRVRLLLFAGALLGRYMFGMTPFILLFDVLLVWAAWKPLRLLTRYAPLIVSLPPKENADTKTA